MKETIYLKVLILIMICQLNNLLWTKQLEKGNKNYLIDLTLQFIMESKNKLNKKLQLKFTKLKNYNKITKFKI